MPTRHAPSRFLLFAGLVALIGALAVPGQGAGAASGPDCGGLTPAKPGGGHWVCTFDEEFDGTSLNRTTWTVQTTAQAGFHSGAECVVDDPNNVSVSGGVLHLTVREQAVPFVCRAPRHPYTTSWTGASIYTRSFDQNTGLFMFRARFPEAHGLPGLQSALWLFPRTLTMSDTIGALIELDVAEAYSQYPDHVAASVHTPMAGRSVACSVPDYGADFHTYAVQWTRHYATFFYDGARCMRAFIPASTERFMVALTQVLGVKANVNDARTPLPATTLVDWVRVWS